MTRKFNVSFKSLCHNIEQTFLFYLGLSHQLESNKTCFDREDKGFVFKAQNKIYFFHFFSLLTHFQFSVCNTLWNWRKQKKRRWLDMTPWCVLQRHERFFITIFWRFAYSAFRAGVSKNNTFNGISWQSVSLLKNNCPFLITLILYTTATNIVLFHQPVRIYTTLV